MLGEVGIVMALLWIAVVFGVLVGWVWRPKWVTGFGRDREASADSLLSSFLGKLLLFFHGSLRSFKMLLCGLLPWIFSDDGFCTDDSSSSLSEDPDTRFVHYMI